MAQLNLRLDDELKHESAEFFESLGMDLSTGIKIYLNKVVREQRIPFELSLPQSDYLRSLREYERGEFKTVESVAELMRELNDED